MLKKLLKYDFQSVMKYWWIAAISSLALSFVGGGCVSLLTREKELPDLVYPFIIFALILVILSFVVFYLMTFIFVFVRFYRNFFTDEGYLFGEGGIGFERINLACPTWVLEEALIRLRKAFNR